MKHSLARIVAQEDIFNAQSLPFSMYCNFAEVSWWYWDVCNYKICRRYL